ncbi:hypothetical protein BC826DRAFT_1071839 [Russula brevipes]|nr:hypothetical protein BC826DRAFT_1071839 [Russula brevipes]
MAAKLRMFSLSLSQVRVPWLLTPCGQLTQLKIAQFDETPIADGPSLGLIDLLKDLLINCVLEILVLEFCLPHNITRPSHVQVYHLPWLLYLSLGGSSSCVAKLMKILKLPYSTTLRLPRISENTATHSDHQRSILSRVTPRLLISTEEGCYGPAMLRLLCHSQDCPRSAMVWTFLAEYVPVSNIAFLSICTPDIERSVSLERAVLTL